MKNNVVLKLDPSASNPRNSEGSFVTLKDGKILFVYSHYTSGNGGDHDPAHLASRISADGGKTWTQQDARVLDNEGGMNVMSVSLLRLKNGEIALFYLRKNTVQDCIPYVRFSKDEAKTWSEPVKCITDKEGYFVLNNDRVIQLKSGRLLMAVALHKNTKTQFSGKGHYIATIRMITAVPGDRVRKRKRLAKCDAGAGRSGAEKWRCDDVHPGDQRKAVCFLFQR